MPRRIEGTPLGTRTDWSLTAAAVAIGILIYLLGDRTNWNAGFGYDGLFYGDLAKNFGAAVFNHGPVQQPGFEPLHPAPSGVDSYYIFRIVPSGVVWLALKVTGMAPTNGNVVGLFCALNAAMYGLATWCWCRSASLLGFGDREKVLGATGLVISFAVLRTGAYYPVATDPTALGLGALSFYLWLRGSTVALVATTFLACFTWPLHFVVGAVMLILPAPEDPRGLFRADAAPPAGDGRVRPTRFTLAVGVAVAAIAVVWMTVLQLGGRVSAVGADQLPLFPLSVAIMGVFIVAILACFLPATPARLWQILRAIRPWRVVLAVVVIGVARAIGSVLQTRSGFGSGGILEEELWWTTLDPGLFLVILVSYLGPLMLALLFDLRRVAADSWRLGAGMATLVAIGLLGSLTTQPREITDLVPLLLVPGVLVVRRTLGLSTPVLVGFFVVSLALSRIWLYIGPLPEDGMALLHFPSQAYYMGPGPWTQPSTYAMQLGAVLLIAALAIGWHRRVGRPSPAH